MKYLFTIIGLGIYCSISAQQITAIQNAMNTYDYEKVIELVDKEPPATSLQVLKARALKGLYRYEEAVNTLKQAIDKEPENLQLLFELAESNKLAGNHQEALSYYEKVLALNPDNKYAALQRANLLYSMDMYQDTKKVCAEMLERDSAAIVLRLMAQSYHGLNLLDSAEIYYLKAIEKNPKDYVSVARLAVILINDKEYESAIELTEKYRNVDKMNIYVNRQNAQAYTLNKEYAKAIERYLELREMGDNNKLSYYYLGMSYFGDEKFFEAHDELQTAYKNDTTNINILYYLGRACAKTSWKKESVGYLQKALELTIPSNEVLAKLYDGLAECYRYNHDYHNQIASILEQYKHVPKEILLYNVGAIYQDALKDPKNAEKYLKMFLKTKPKESPAEEGHMEGNTLVLNETTYYKAAERRLNDLNKEKFWEGESK